jgi:hypothetical protein
VNENGTALANKSYTLNTYKLSKNAVTNPYNNIDCFYLREKEAIIQSEAKGIVAGGSGVGAGALLVLRKGEYCKIRTLLSSTRLTQNHALLSLLLWNGEVDQMGDIIKRFTFVDVIEVMKFVPETFERLFNMLIATPKSNPPSLTTLEVYDAIVRVITLFVDDKKGQVSMRVVLDRYIKLHFQTGEAHYFLLACMGYYFRLSSSSPNSVVEGSVENLTARSSSQSKLIATLKALEFLLKLVIKSRNVNNKVVSQTDPNNEFKRDVLAVFEALNNLMKLKGIHAHIITVYITRIRQGKGL